MDNFDETATEFLDASASDLHIFNLDVGPGAESFGGLAFGGRFEGDKRTPSVGTELYPVGSMFDDSNPENCLPKGGQAVWIIGIDDDGSKPTNWCSVLGHRILLDGDAADGAACAGSSVGGHLPDLMLASLPYRIDSIIRSK